MDTLNSVASAAAKAVWGSTETKQEPVSGLKGNTTAGEPYDAGNMEPAQVPRVETPVDEQHVDKHIGTAANTDVPGNDMIKDSDASNARFPDTNSTPEHNASSVAADSVADAQHGFSQPLDRLDEKTIPEAELKKPGPKPLEALARERGGDAGNASKDGELSTQPKSRDGQDEGTGEKHVKSTGFAAEGGDFDAAAAGAGREADRLLEEHGSPDPGDPGKFHDHSETKHISSSPNASAEKRSLKEKIKAKLHKH